MSLDPAANPLWQNLVGVCVCAAMVWWAGGRLAAIADQIATRTGMSRSIAGILLLAVVTSLPELATTISAAWLGAARMAANNLLGGVAMQTAVLALVDLVAVRGALTRIAPGAALLMQGVVLTILLGLALAGTAADLPQIGPIGITSVVICAVHILGVWAVRGYEARPAWVPRTALEEVPRVHGDDDPFDSTARAFAWFGFYGVIILAAGWFVAQTGHVLAEQTGLGEGFIGATLVAGTTTLPEISTTLGAARRGAYTMAISNIFGSNSFDLSLLLVADAVYTGGPILHAADRSAIFVAGLGIVLTAIYLWGMLERRDRTIMRMGYDSLAVVVAYVIGLVVLYRLRGDG
jgi:cation:H+ antiporter